ncbi:MAG: hypothetical protein P1U68_17665 [Verrucomicrobiales bacterium]|nr:hypothetical protein [Verrucomicrobiales bacterium]
MQKKSTFLPVISLLLVVFTSSLRGDEIQLKNGELLTGRITYEADDIVKIEVAVSASIKETKIISRSDIAKIAKEAPDSVAFKKISEMLPVRSLTGASSYKSMIETGPNSFLRLYPDSVHADKVTEIKTQLDEELDKVERGFIKLEGDWLSPKEQAEFETLVKSRVQMLKMEAASRSGNYNGIISAMREFEVIEEKYYGTPAFPKAVELALVAVPALGRQLTGMLRDVEYRNAEYERNKAALDEVATAQVEAALQREEANYQAGIAADKKAGIKWVRLNPRSKPSIEGYLKLAGSELNRIKEYDVEQLKLQAEKLVQVDELIAKGNYELARTKLTEAAAITGRKASSKKSSSKGSSSYIAALNTKLNDRVAEETAKEKARAEAAESQALAENLSKAAKKKSSSSEADPENETESPEGEEAEGTVEKDPQDLFSALSDSGKNEKPKEKSPSKKKPTDDEEKERPRPVTVDEGGGFSLGLIIPIVTVLLLVTVLVLKFLGIGAKKDEDEDGETPVE